MNEIVATLKDIDPDNLSSMISALNKVENSLADSAQKIKISFLRNMTIEPIEWYLKFHLYQAGFKLECVFGDYDSVKQEILGQAYLVSDYQPDIIVWSLYHHVDGSPITDLVMEEIHNTLDLLREQTQAFVLINTFIPPFYTSLGIHENEAVISSYMVMNQKIRVYAAKYSSRFCIMDWERYTRILGENSTIDYRYWYMNRSPFKSKFLNLYAQDIARAVNAFKGQIKKCLVLDCDNTLWGGIIGEDGLYGIKLDNQDYPGKIFYDFQQYLLKLVDRGVIVALCSKNNSDDVWNVIENHPHNLLKRRHIVAARINWEDKASNIMSLSKELNLGLDSFVFVDDNPMECELVKSALPSVEVLMVPTVLHNYPQLLLKTQLFDSLLISKEDLNRTLMYQQEATRKSLAEKYDDLDSYLRSLELELVISKMTIGEVARVAQLTQKTNQFNLTVKRYSEQEIQQFLESDDHVIFSLKVKDKFGDYGLTGVFIGRKIISLGIIDSFLLSCRVLSRNVEHAFMAYCLNFLSCKWHLSGWEANFLPTGKNSQVETFLTAFGFTKKDSTDTYQIPVMLDYPSIDYIKITEGF